MWILAVACLAFALLMVVVTVLDSDKELLVKVALCVGFGAGAFYCFGEAGFVRGSFDREGISYSTPWTGSKNEAWKDLESVALNDWAGWYTLTFKSGRKIRLSRYLGGHVSALEFASATS